MSAHEFSRRYLEIPGSATHELPPLLVRGEMDSASSREDVVELASRIVESEDIIPDETEAGNVRDQRKLDLALHLTDQYYGLLQHWNWGDSILEWIRQCEITFDHESALRHLLNHQIWPHAGRSTFVNLLLQKDVPTHGVGLEKAVGLRLTFRQPPPIDCFSNQFLFFLNSSVAGSAYQTWSQMGADSPGLLPPDRFVFQVLEMGLTH
jgi:hypothetical protein